MTRPIAQSHSLRPTSRSAHRLGPALAALCGGLLLAGCGGPPQTEEASPAALQGLASGDITALGRVRVPTPTRVLWASVDYTNPQQVASAVRLGKALFWDQQVGEYKDASRPVAGVTDMNGEQEYAAVTGMACASCHFAAGTDGRRDGDVRRAGSAGVVATTLVAQQLDGDEVCQPADGAGVIQRTGANTPPAVGAVYNRLQFWNGRASNMFNGHNPFGNGAGETSDFPGGEFQNNSSLASQADGPANNPVEMTCGSRNWTHLGRKLLGRRPLGTQTVAANDSVFTGWVTAGKLSWATYRELIDETFPGVYATDDDKVAYFGMIWGQAIQAYERTLQPTQTPLDRFLNGATAALSPLASRGFDVFKGKGNCAVCHAGPSLSDATVDMAQKLGLLREDGGTMGFHNLGVTAESADPGHEAFSGRIQDRGAFKTPALRNVALTAPYMHDGSLKTIDEVIDFYVTGGKTALGRRMPGAANPHLDPKLKPISLNADDRRALRAFLLTGLTDPRVAADAGPFDHPSLTFNDGSPGLCATDASGVKVSCP